LHAVFLFTSNYYAYLIRAAVLSLTVYARVSAMCTVNYLLISTQPHTKSLLHCFYTMSRFYEAFLHVWAVSTDV